MVLIYPETCITPASRLEFCYKAQENFRILHNFFGEWYDPDFPDMPFNRWEGIPAEMKLMFPYQPKIDKETFDGFFTNVFHPASQAIGVGIHEAKEAAKISEYWNPDFSNLGD